LHLAVFTEVDPQHGFFAASEISGHCTRLVIRSCIGCYFHAKPMISGGNLRGVEFMSLDMVENDQALLIRSFQRMRVGQAIIHPYR